MGGVVSGGDNMTGHMIGQVDSMGEMLLSYLQKHWPGGGLLDIRNFTRITSGWESEVYSFQLVNQSDDTSSDLVLRVYPGNDAKAKSRWEFGIIDLLSTTGFPVPDVYLLEVEASPFLRPFLIMEKISGPSLRELISNATPHDATGLVNVFCQLFVDLHSWNWREHEATLASISKAGRISDLKVELRTWQRLAGLGWESTFDWLLTQHAKLVDQPPCLTHGDFHPDNIIMREESIPYVIDWGGARLQDFRLDLAWTILLVGTYDRWEMGEMILEQYESILGKNVADIHYFYAVAALRRLLSVYISVTSGAAELGMRQGAETMMVRDLPHLWRVYQVWQSNTGMDVPVIQDFLDELDPKQPSAGNME